MNNIPLNLRLSNIKIVNDSRILGYSSGEEHVIYEIDLSGKVLKKEYKNTQSARLGRNVPFVTYGQDKLLYQIGRSNDFILYDVANDGFSFTKLLCDDVLSASKEEDLIKNHGNRYLRQFPDLKFIDGTAGTDTHLLFGCGSGNEKFSIYVFNIKDRKIQYVISEDDIDDVTFTSVFFTGYAECADGKDCFIAYIYPGAIYAGLKEHPEFIESVNNEALKKIFETNEKERDDQNPVLIEFMFK
jgi:hypothetical protein